MNYTEQELEISNKSYTNKDFNTIYPELLDLVKKLTNKWDPTTSNESDPGVVLLKLWAILADKNNYNIDKNILETFPLSVTQRSNAQKLYDMLGYNMHHYISAVTDVDIWYIGNIPLGNESTTNLNRLTIPKFTMITDDSGENVFTLTDEAVISAKASKVIVKAIQGTVHDYEVNGITDITLDNLDSEYRLFFTESRIAENGIFIANKGLGTLNYDEWKRTSNLESATLNSKIYKFGVLPNTQSCYIQFPQDIGTLIGNGLKIKYIISDGENGNIQANQLTTFNGEIIPFEVQESSLGDTEYYNKSINQDVIIKNSYSTSTGADPEDLDSAYKNYKKTIGTFNTLVTVEDYEKAIYQLVDDLGLPFCSNVVVSDRTNNINYSTNVITLNGNAIENQLVVDSEYLKEKVYVKNGPSTYGLKEDDTYYVKKDKMSAFDLGLYILNPMLDIEDETGYYYNKSFSVTTLYNDIVSQISEVNADGNSTNLYKSAEHDFLNTVGSNVDTITLTKDSTSTSTSGELPYIFKNFYTLTGKIVTYYKVSQEEAKDIEKNIKLALFRDYNARKVNFGEPIKYENIVKTIENADTRIKTLILNEPEYTLKYMAGNDPIGSFGTAISLPLNKGKGNTSANFTKDLMYRLLLKMILSGHVQLYDFNNDITFDFGQTDIRKYENIKYITTQSSIQLVEGSGVLSDTGYKVPKNNNIQLYAPNFYTKTIYSAYVNYWFDSSNASCPANGFKSNVYYTLPKDMVIQLQYTDENGIVKTPKIEGGKKFRFTDSGDSSAILKMNDRLTIDKEIEGTTYTMCTLTATQQIEIIEVNEVTFPKESSDQNVLYCMWFTNKSITREDKDKNQRITEYVLFDKGEKQHILQDNEYFIYTNSEKNELVVLGSGTMLVRSSSYTSRVSYSTKIPANAILEKGQSAISDADWYRYALSESNGVDRSLKLVELQIISLGENAGIRCSLLEDSNEETTLSNSPIKVTNPQYCEIYNNKNPEENNWVPLNEYNLDVDSNDWYYKGWSIISRLNSNINPVIPQKLSSSEKLLLYKAKDEGSEEENVAELSDTNILSNTILMFGGGTDLEVSSSNNKSINIYSYTEAPLPSIIDNNGQRFNITRGDDGFISILLRDWVRYGKDNYSKDDSERDLENRKFYLNFDSNSQSPSTVAVTLNGERSNATIRIYKSDSIYYDEYALNSTNKVKYISLPGNVSYLELSNFKLEGELPNNVVEKLKVWESVSDILRIGYPKVKKEDKYSSQIETTLKYVYGESGPSIDPIAYIKTNYPNFNLTYEVPKEDLIDGKVGPRSNWDNLFAGDLIWDKNHICNKYTIPQYDFENSSIEIAPHMIKG